MASGTRVSSGSGEGGAGAMEVALLWGDRLLDVRQFDPAHWPVGGQMPKDAIDASERALIEAGALRVVTREVVQPARVKADKLRDVDYSFAKLMLLTAMIAVAVLVIMSVPGSGVELMDDSVFKGAGAEVIKRMPPKPPAKITPLRIKAPAATKAVAATASGAPRSSRKAAADAGSLLDALKRLGSNGVFTTDGIGDPLNTAIGAIGTKGTNGIPNGFAGLGGPRGGDCTGPNCGVGLGIDGAGTNRFGGPIGAITGNTLRQRTEVKPSGPPKIEGGLDRDQIAKVIRRHQSEIKYCYESSLNEFPDLEGKVAMTFMIDPTGHVADVNVAETTLENEKVERCMLSRIRAWKFPEPRGGGVVTVNFPWLFRRAGSGN